MSMAYSAAKTYITQIIGAQNDASSLTRAGDSLKATLDKWNRINRWRFLLRDNEAATVIACTTNGTTTLTGTGFTALYAGGGVSGTNIVAGTTIASITNATTLILSTAASGSGTQNATFAGGIPIIVGTNAYAAPADLSNPYSARFATDPHTLQWMEQREFDRKVANQPSITYVTHYTIYTGASFNASSQGKQLKLFGTPASGDVMYVRYYRNMALPSADADIVDIIDEYLYALLDDARVHFLGTRSTTDTRLPYLAQVATEGMRYCISDDMQLTDDEDTRLLSQMEVLQRNPSTVDTQTWWI